MRKQKRRLSSRKVGIDLGEIEYVAMKFAQNLFLTMYIQGTKSVFKGENTTRGDFKKIEV